MFCTPRLQNFMPLTTLYRRNGYETWQSSSLCVFVTYWMPHAQGVFVKRKHHPKQRKKDKSGGQHNKLRCEWNSFVTVTVTTIVHIQ